MPVGVDVGVFVAVDVGVRVDVLVPVGVKVGVDVDIAAPTLTVSEQVLLVKLPSAGLTTLFGSTAHVVPLPLRGLLSVPAPVPVTGTVTVTGPPLGMLIRLLPFPPVHVTVLLAMLHVQLPLAPTASTQLTLP